MQQMKSLFQNKVNNKYIIKVFQVYISVTEEKITFVILHVHHQYIINNLFQLALRVERKYLQNKLEDFLSSQH